MNTYRLADIVVGLKHSFQVILSVEMMDTIKRLSGDENPLHCGRYAVQSYLDHHANKLARRFDAGSYVALTDAMNTWYVGRGRGGVERALRSLEVPVLVAGIDTDRLYPVHLQEQIAELAGNTVTGLRIIKSDFGHDGFLIEHDEVFALVEEILDLAEGQLSAG